MDKLRTAIRRLLRLCLRSRWRDWMIPKFHWTVHLPRHLARFGCLPTTWVHERKHRVAKRYSNGVRNLSDYERSVSKEIICHNLADLVVSGLFDLYTALIHPHVPTSALLAFLRGDLGLNATYENCRTAATARIGGKGDSCCKSDVVFIKAAGGGIHAGRVWFHIELDGSAFSLVDLWGPAAHNAKSGWILWKAALNLCVLPTDDITVAVVNRIEGDQILTLVPYSHRTFKPVPP